MDKTLDDTPTETDEKAEPYPIGTQVTSVQGAGIVQWADAEGYTVKLYNEPAPQRMPRGSITYWPPRDPLASRPAAAHISTHPHWGSYSCGCDLGVNHETRWPTPDEVAASIIAARTSPPAEEWEDPEPWEHGFRIRHGNADRNKSCLRGGCVRNPRTREEYEAAE